MGDLGVLVVVATPILAGAATLAFSMRNLKRETSEYREKQKTDFESRFLEGEDSSNGLYPVSELLVRSMGRSPGDDIQREQWMAEVKRYEGNPIVSEEIKSRYWENLELVNDKYFAFDDAMDELVRKGNDRHSTRREYEGFKAQVIEMQLDIIERCRVCYDFMKEDAAREKNRRTSLTVESSANEKDEALPEQHRFVASEERALLNILESPKANDEMKAEAKSLLAKWRALQGEPADESGEIDSMKDDLTTITRIIEGQQLGIQD